MSRTPPYLAARSGMTTERLFSRRQDRMEDGSLEWRVLMIGRYHTFKDIDIDVDGYLQAKADIQISQPSMFQFFDVLRIIAVLGFCFFSKTDKHCQLSQSA